MEQQGRSRGRGRARANPAQPKPQQSFPGEQPAPANFSSKQAVGAPPSGRGRGRQASASDAQTPATGIVNISERMAGMSVGNGNKRPEAPVGPSGDRQARGGLQRRLRNTVLEADIQPANISDKIGNIGAPVDLKTNFALFKALPNQDFFVYQVRFSWAMTFKQKFAQLKQLQGSGHLAQGPFAYDGMRTYSTQSWTVDSETPLQLVLSETKTISVRQVSSGVVGSEQYYHLLNIIFSNVQVLLGQDRVGRGYYMPATSEAGAQRNDGVAPVVQKFQHLTLHGGYETAFQRGTINGQPVTIMHIDKSHRILSQQTAYDFLQDVGKSQYGPKKTEILGRQIMTKYNNRTYTINDIKENVNISSTFEVEEKETKREISYLQYFRERYNIELKNNVQTFVVSRSKKRDVQKVKRNRTEGAAAEPERGGAPEDSTRELLLPSELCFLCGLSESEKTNYQRDRQFNELTKRGPRERVNDVRDFQKWISTNPQTGSFLRDWGLEFSSDNLSVKGRELPCPGVRAFNIQTGKYDVPLEMRDRSGREIVRGEWDPKNVKMNSKKSYKLGVMMRQGISNKQFLNYLSQVSKQMNMNFTEITDDDIVTLGRDADISAELMEFMKMGYEIVLCAGIRPQDYTPIKSCTVDTGLLTQCIVKKNFEDQRKGMSIATKVAIQMGCKLGLDAWRVNYSCPRAKTMVVGMDTHHNKSQKSSVHAAVFSCNNAFTQYINIAWTDTGKNEMNPRMISYFVKGLNLFKEKNNFLPERIVVFRDGVGDSQLETMKSVEVEDLKEAVVHIYPPNNPPHIVIIVVKKRISARFFLQRGPSTANPSAGTVVDTGIVKPKFYEFFLVSQLTRQGTATPSNYNVVEDTQPATTVPIHLSPSEIQQFAFSLTHLYYNWPGTIRVPAPVHYAHRLAFLIGQSLPRFKEIHPSISDKLFYL